MIWWDIFSVVRTTNKIKERYWFPYRKRHLRRHIAIRFEYLMNKVPEWKQQGILHTIKPGRTQFSFIHTDYLGPFVKSSYRNQSLLIIIDNFTRFTRLFLVKDASALHVIKAVKEFGNDYGLPDRITSKRSSCFSSCQFEQYCKDDGMHHTLNLRNVPKETEL